jgi:hemolysin activation/secretion protein
MQLISNKRRRLWLCLCTFLGAAIPLLANAQTDGLHMLGLGQLRVPLPPQLGRGPQPGKGGTPSYPHTTSPPAGIGGFVLRRIVIEGSSSVPRVTLENAVAPAIGHPVNGADLNLIVQRMAICEAEAGIALYSVSIPQQKIRHGVLHLRIVESAVVHVVITGQTDHAKIGLMRAYAQNIMRSRPLRRDVLERNILLMGDIAGSKIGSVFKTNPARPGQVTLVLSLQETKFFGGFSVNNQGSPLLYNTQAVFNAGMNNLFRQGERTQLVLGLPLDVTRYQFYGINDLEPIGGNGLTASLNAGELLSYPAAGDATSGNAEFLNTQLNAPVVRSVHRNINLGAGFNYLNSANAFLGATTSDERTRTLRFSMLYNDDEYFNGVNRISPSITEGLNILGARRASLAYGGPSFTKGELSFERLQILPANFLLRLSGTGQFTTDRLPPSAEFYYGGVDYGQAFYAAELTGDEGIAGLGELSHPIDVPYFPRFLAGTTIFTSVDYGEIWNRDPVYVVNTDRGASFAAGFRLMVFHKLQLQLGAATPLIEPESVPGNQHWRFVIATSGQF